MHGRLDVPDLQPLFHAFADVPLVSISDAQQAPLRFANWCRTVYHGLPLDLLPFQPKAEPYLAFLGRLSPEKRVDRAVEIARQLGLPLKVAAKIDGKDRDYYEHKVKPLFAAGNVEFLGEIGERDKADFLGKASAFLFPVDWPEPFGLVMIEALACGTPVVAFRCGSTPEVMRDGVSGYVVDTLDGAVAATARALELPRKRCRAYFEARFSARRMAEDYLRVYEGLVAGEYRRAGGGLDLVPAADGETDPSSAGAGFELA
jgi:glycosyltransferase involved in cell wall biosynthesis